MPKLEEVEIEYRKLSARLTYDEFEGPIDPADERRLEQLAEWRVALSAPRFDLEAA